MPKQTNILLPSPKLIKEEISLSSDALKKHRKAIKNIHMCFDKKKFAIVLGPCSIHEEESAIELAQKIHELQNKISPSILLVMRVYIEKPRSKLDWKGFLYDPNRNGEIDILDGIKRSRKLMLQIHKLGIPIAMEFLDPLLAPYFDDLVSWGVIGARTTTSQIHRQLASSMEIPFGFKNTIDGNIQAAINAAYTSSQSQLTTKLNNEGKIIFTKTRGNPNTHIILRGSKARTNYDYASLEKSAYLMRFSKTYPIMVDCSHGNSKKDPLKQVQIAKSILKENHPLLMGYMLETNLFTGSQKTGPSLKYGISITDSCLGWRETKELIYYTQTKLETQKEVSCLRSIASTQN